MIKRVSIALVAGLVLWVVPSSPALAQLASPIRYNEGPGIKLSDSLVFHPGIAVEGRYDSNVQLLSTSSPYTNIEGAPLMRIVGHVDLATTSPERVVEASTGDEIPLRKVEFRLKGAAAYREYFHDNPAIRSRRSVEVDAGLNLKLFPKHVFSVELLDDYVRSYPTWSGVNAPRNTNRSGVNLLLAPGGQRLTFQAGYAMNFDIYDDSAYQFADKYFHQVNFMAKWKLLPMTAVFLQLDQRFVDYYNNTATPESMPMRLYLGFAGLITARFSVVARLGYGNSFHDSGDSFNSVLAHIQAQLHIGPFAKVFAGYQHNFQDSMLTNYYTDEHVYLGYDHLVFNRVLLHFKGDYRYRQYMGDLNGIVATAAMPEDLINHLVRITVAGDYKIRSWVYVGLEYLMDARVNPDGYTDVTENPAATYINGYTRHQVAAKVGFSY